MTEGKPESSGEVVSAGVTQMLDSMSPATRRDFLEKATPTQRTGFIKGLHIHKSLSTEEIAKYTTLPLAEIEAILPEAKSKHVPTETLAREAPTKTKEKKEQGNFWGADPYAWMVASLAVQRRMSMERLAGLLTNLGYVGSNGIAITADALHAYLNRTVGKDPERIQANVEMRIEECAREGRYLSDTNRKAALEFIKREEKKAGINSWLNSTKALGFIAAAIEEGYSFYAIDKVLSEGGYTNSRDLVTKERSTLDAGGLNNFFRREVLNGARGTIPELKEEIISFIEKRTALLNEPLTEEQRVEIQRMVAAIPPKVSGPAKGTPKPPRAAPTSAPAEAPEPIKKEEPPVEKKEDTVGMPAQPREDPFSRWGETRVGIKYRDTSMANSRMVVQPVTPQKYVQLHREGQLGWQLEGTEPPSSYPTIEEAREKAFYKK